MGSLIGSVINGEYTKTDTSQEATKTSTTSTSKTAETTNNGYSEEMFLQLLVAEMQYQDPLEPTDNSQYVAQLASFSQIEAIQSVQEDMKTIQGNSMVGKMVAINVDNEEIHGRVDYVRTDDDGNLVASVNNTEYPVEKITSIMDEDYYNTVLVADKIISDISNLPNANLLTLADKEAVESVATMLGSIDEYTMSFIDDDVLSYFESVYNRLTELIKDKEEADEEAAAAAEAATTTSSTTEEVVETEETEETEEVSGE